MAIKKVIDIDVNAKSAIGELDHLKKSFADVYGEVQPLSGRTGELEDRLYELALAGKQNTKEFKDLSSEVAKAKKVIIDVDMAVDGMSNTMANKVAGALGGVTSGFALGAGVMGAFGADAEKLEETLLKVQSAMAMAQGVQGIRESIPAFKAMGKSAMTALSGIKTGIAATGIGVLLIAVGALAANWDKVTDALGKQTSAQKLQNSVASSALATISAELSASDKLGKILKDESISRAEKVAAVKAVQKEYPDLLSNIDAEKTSTDDINKALDLNTDLLNLNAQVKAIAELRSAQYAISLQAEVDAQTGANEGIINSIQAWTFGADAKEFAIAKSRLAIKETEKETAALDNLEKSLNKQIKAVREKGAVTSEDTEATKTNTNAQRESAQAAREAAEAYAQNRKEAIREIQDLEDANRFDNEQKEQDANLRMLERFKQDTIERTDRTESEKQALILAKEEETWLKRKEISERWLSEMNTALDEADAERKIIKDENAIIDQTLALEKAAELSQAARDLEAQRDEEAAERKKQTIANVFDAASTSLNALDELNTFLTDSAVAKAGANEAAAEAARKKGFERSKKLQLTMAIITGIQGVMAAFTAGSSMGPAGVVMGPVMAALAAVGAVVNVAKISKMQYDGGGGAAAASVGTVPSIPNPASFDVVGNSNTNQLADSLSAKPVQAFVVGGDVTTQQSLDRNKVATASM